MICFSVLFSSNPSFDAQWKQVDKFVNEGKPQSALTIVEEIYTAATKAKAEDHLLKSILYKHKLSQEVEEIELAVMLQRLENDLESQELPRVKALLASVTGSMYRNYLQRNFHRLKDRAEIGTVSTDITLWSIPDIEDRADALILQSYAVKFKDVSIEEFSVLFDREFEKASLREFLLMEAIRHFQHDVSYMTGVVDNSNLDAQLRFMPLDELLKMEFEESIAPSKRKLLVLYHYKLLLAELESKKSLDIHRINLMRLQWAKQFVGADRESTTLESDYRSRLRSTYDEANSDDEKALYGLYLAKDNIEIANQYTTNFESKYEMLGEDAMGILNKLTPKNNKLRGEIEGFMDQLRHVEFYANNKEIIVPHRAFPLHITYKNVNEFHIKVFPLEFEEYISYKSRNSEKRMRSLLKKKAIAHQVVQMECLSARATYIQHSTEIILDGLPVGQYAIIISNSSDFSSKSTHPVQSLLVQSSNLDVLSWSELSGQKALVVDRTSGHPIEDAILNIHTYDYRSQTLQNNLGTYKSDREGIIQINDAKIRRAVCILSKADDKVYLDNFNLSIPHQRQETAQAFCFLDRSIYRPGQMIKGKLLLMQNRTSGMPELLKQKSVDITFYDANRQVIKTLTLKTNTYGSCRFDLLIPTEGLKGNYSIDIRFENGRGYQAVKVEEYRRPEQELVFEKGEGSLVLGDSVSIAGSVLSYSGFPKQDAVVNYVIKEQEFAPYFRCGWDRYCLPPRYFPSKILSSGATKTDEKGLFLIDFSSNADKESFGKNYTIDVTVNDKSGATITKQKNITLTNDAFSIQHNISDVFAGNIFNPVEITALNYDNDTVLVESNLTIRQYKATPSHSKSRSYFVDCLMHSPEEYNKTFYAAPESSSEGVIDSNFEQITTSKDKLESVLINLDPGKYEIRIDAIDPDGRASFLVFDMMVAGKNRETPIMLGYRQGGEISALAGTAIDPQIVLHKDVDQVFVQKIKGSNVIWSRWLDRSDCIDWEIPITEEDAGGFSIHYSTWLNDDYFTHTMNIDVPFRQSTNKVTIDVPTTLKPNQEAAIGLSLANPVPQMAYTVVMYDASLDAIYPHAWYSSFFPRFYSHIWHSQPGRNHAPTWSDGRYRDYNREYLNLDYIPRTRWFDLMSANYHWNQRGEGRFLKRSRSVPMSAEADMVVANGAREETADFDASQTQELQPAAPEVRQNFAETVFFESDLISDTAGKLSYDFRTNDALSRWKIMVLGISTDFEYVYSEKEVVTTKEVILTQNYTRVFTQGDKIDWPILLENTSESSIAGDLTIEVRSAITNEDMTQELCNNSIIRQLSLPAQGSKSFLFPLQIPIDSNHPLEVKAVFTSGTVSDATIHTIPILSKDAYLTEGKSIWVGPENLQKLDYLGLQGNASARIENLELQITHNPIWLVAESFPNIQTLDQKVTTNLSNQFFVESIARQLILENTQLVTQYQQFLDNYQPSGLNANQHLKGQSLENTPWLNDARSHEQRTYQFAQYFNQSESDRRLATIINKLRSRVNPDGGLPWLQGGRSSLYTSLDFFRNLAYLKDEEITLNTAEQLDLTQLMGYIDTEIAKQWKKRKKDQRLSTRDLNYLYVKSVFQDLGGNTQITNRMRAKLEKEWVQFPISSQALAGLIMINFESKDQVKQIQESFEERAITREDGTVTWRGINEYYSHTNDIKAQAMVSAFLSKANASPEILDKSTQWLIANKKLNSWANEKSIASVVYYLLLNYGSAIDQSKPVKVQLDGSPLQLEDGIHSSRARIPHEYSNGFELVVNNEAQYPIFGGIYLQYFQDKALIKQPENPKFSLSKSIFLKKIENNLPVYCEIEEETVSVGDRLRVRLEIVSHDQLSYCYLSDERPTGTEPQNQLSQFIYKNGLYGYESTSDKGMEYFIEVMPKGTHTFEYDLIVTQAGMYNGGVAQLQSYYSPDMSAFDTGGRLNVDSSNF